VQIKAMRPLQHAIEVNIDKALLGARIAHIHASGTGLDGLVCRWIAEGLERAKQTLLLRRPRLLTARSKPPSDSRDGSVVANVIVDRRTC
jgi:hypothetical protein